jgi:hypothetical protein
LPNVGKPKKMCGELGPEEKCHLCNSSLNKVKQKTEQINFSFSPCFDYKKNDEVINHSFSSEMHLKNNKNFIPKEQICRNLRSSLGSQDENSNVSSLRNSDKVFPQEEIPKPSTFSTINFYTSINQNIRSPVFPCNKEIASPFSPKNFNSISNTTENFDDNQFYNFPQIVDENYNPNIFPQNFNFQNIPNYYPPSYQTYYNSNSNPSQVQEFSKPKVKNHKKFIDKNFQQKSLKIHLNPNSMEYKPNNFHLAHDHNPKSTKSSKGEIEFSSEKKLKIPVNYADMTDEEISNYCYSLAKDQLGCRFLQRKIEENLDFANKWIFPKIKNYVTELSNDSFGNYLIQKVLEYLNEDNICQVLDIVKLFNLR